MFRHRNTSHNTQKYFFVLSIFLARFNLRPAIFLAIKTWVTKIPTNTTPPIILTLFLYSTAQLHKVESKSMATGNNTYRDTIFLEKAFVEDNSFPFRAGERLIAKIEADRLVIAKKID